MARTRNIKPAFFTNDTLSECSIHARLLFIGLWTIADKAGRLEDRPKKIKAELFPYDNCDCNELLGELHRFGFITRYEIDSIRCIQINNFTKHQNPHPKEQASTLPEKGIDLKEEIKGSDPVSDEPCKGDDKSSLLSFPSSSNPSLGACADAQPNPTVLKIPKARRLTKEWVLPVEWGEWAMKEGLSRQQVLNEEESFRDYWIAKAGKDATKQDWEATWRNWVRKAKEYGRVKL